MRRPSPRTRSDRRARPGAALALAALALVSASGSLPLGAGRADAAPVAPIDVVLPVATGLVLDGRGTEPAWEGAVALPAQADEGPTPTVRALASAGRLWLLVESAEDVGFAIGVKAMVCADGTASAAEAVQLAFGPQEIRAARYTVRGPRGTGRGTYRFEGAADLTRLGRWSIETSIPFEDVGLKTDTTPIRLAVVVSSRRVNAVASAPPGAAFAAPDAFARLAPPPGGWSSTGAATADAAAIAAADDADAKRMAAWSDLKEALTSGAIPPAEARAKLIAPLDRAIAARPDLAELHVVKGSILSEIGDHDGAKAAYRAALAAVPNFPEAAWALVSADVSGFTEGAPGTPSDYPAALARIAAARTARPEAAVALDAAEGVFRYRLGEFDAAVRLLEPVVLHYPVDDQLAGALTSSKKYVDLFAQELGMREADAKNDTLPRVKLTTSKGAVTLELFEDDAPNTVANFLWLVRHGYYDGMRFHRVIPFFMAQGGVAEEPTWTIRTEPSKRRPLRGVIAMANAGRDTESGQFFITTGTSAHLDGDFSVFGRVLEGQSVVDALVIGDTAERVEILRAREHEYRPTTLAGTPAPVPPKRRPPPPPAPPVPPTPPAAPEPAPTPPTPPVPTPPK